MRSSYDDDWAELLKSKPNNMSELAFMSRTIDKVEDLVKQGHSRDGFLEYLYRKLYTYQLEKMSLKDLILRAWGNQK